MKNKKNKFKLKSKPLTKSISSKLDKLIKRKQRDLQTKENIEFGKRGQFVTYQFASDKIAAMMEGRK